MWKNKPVEDFHFVLQTNHCGTGSSYLDFLRSVGALTCPGESWCSKTVRKVVIWTVALLPLVHMLLCSPKDWINVVPV